MDRDTKTVSLISQVFRIINTASSPVLVVFVYLHYHFTLDSLKLRKFVYYKSKVE